MISVIVPVYNVEQYLSQCIESILIQTYKNFELILVDDGSTDSSGKMCDEYSVRDSRVKVIHKTNGGGARDAIIKGISSSSGDYIYFVDSDDYIKPETLEALLNSIQKYDADCVQYQAIYLHNDIQSKHTERTLEIIEGPRIVSEIIEPYLHSGSMAHTQWSYGRHDKFYTAEIIKKVVPHLDSNVTLCEDIEMSLWVALYCKKIVILEDSYLYYWRFVENSISRKMVANTISKHTYFLNALKLFAQLNKFNYDGLKIISGRIYVDLMVTALSRNIPAKEKSDYLKQLKKLISNRKIIADFASNYYTITKYSLIYTAYMGTFLPSLLSQIYLKLKK